MRRGEAKQAGSALAAFPSGLGTITGLAAEYLVTRGLVEHGQGQPTFRDTASEAADLADRQGAVGWRRLATILAHIDDQSRLSDLVTSIGNSSPWHLSFLAEPLVARLEALDAGAATVIARAAEVHQTRWQRALRQHLNSHAATGVEPARLLEAIGEREDVARLRAIARARKRGSPHADLGRQLARRVADRIWVEDLGRVSIHVGHRLVAGSAVRRKVLALMCLLITRNFKATRDQVLDALWPELSPEVAANSLNQTIYFLRRTFEEDYVEDLSPGYVGHDSDVVWLDEELIGSRSSDVRSLIRGFDPADPRSSSILGRGVHRALRPRLRVRGVGRWVPGLAACVVPGDRRTGCTR